MTPEVVRKYTVPRWYYTAVKVHHGETIRVEPDTFANSTKYRMKLTSLSFGSPNPTAYDAHAQPNEHPTWTNRLLVTVGKSNCGDMNLVAGSLSSLCGNLRRVRTVVADSNMARGWRLPTPYMVPRDEGLRVSVEWIKPQYTSKSVAVGPEESGEVTFIAKGYKPDGYPAMLAGRVDSFAPGVAVVGAGASRGGMQLMNSADLFNNGKTEIYLTEFLFKELDKYYSGGDLDWFTTGNSFNFAWQVNPSNPTFTQFMPQPRHIPGGLLAPMTRGMDGGAESPLVYFFPEGTYLDPKQALSVHLGNTTTTGDIEVHVCLAGELEVK
jgi:hypothetical protein